MNHAKTPSYIQTVILPALSAIAMLTTPISVQGSASTSEPAGTMADASPEQICEAMAWIYDGHTQPPGYLYKDLQSSFRIEAGACIFSLRFEVDEAAFVKSYLKQAKARGEELTSEQARERINQPDHLAGMKATSRAMMAMEEAPKIPHLVYEIVVADNSLFPGYTVRSDDTEVPPLTEQ